MTNSLFSSIVSCYISSFVNPLKWSNTFKQFDGNLPTNCLIVFGQLVGLAIKDLMKPISLSIRKIHLLFCLFLPGRGSYSKLPNEEQRLQKENDRMVSNLATKISTLKNVSQLQ